MIFWIEFFLLFRVGVGWESFQKSSLLFARSLLCTKLILFWAKTLIIFMICLTYLLLRFVRWHWEWRDGGKRADEQKWDSSLNFEVKYRIFFVFLSLTQPWLLFIWVNFHPVSFRDLYDRIAYYLGQIETPSSHMGERMKSHKELWEEYEFKIWKRFEKEIMKKIVFHSHRTPQLRSFCISFSFPPPPSVDTAFREWTLILSSPLSSIGCTYSRLWSRKKGLDFRYWVISNYFFKFPFQKMSNL